MIAIQANITEMDNIFERYRDTIGNDFDGYRNHVYRMVHFCLTLRDCSEEEARKIHIAGVFHDIGLWTRNTLDYLDPSVEAARRYLEEQGLEAWSEEISLMISEHHKLRSYPQDRYPLVEVFRKGDLVDFSLGLFKFDVSRDEFKQVCARFPNAGFHVGLVKKLAGWFIRHPLNPAPMMKF